MELLNIFTQIGEWLKTQANAAIVAIVLSFISGLLVKKGWSVMIDNFSKKATVVCKELGETLFATSSFFDKVDKSIHDDGTIDQNSLKEALAAGKEVYIEGKDVIASFKPKKELQPVNEIKEDEPIVEKKRTFKR
jgi:hypothetical protein